jgi:hypothetical protein
MCSNAQLYQVFPYIYSWFTLSKAFSKSRLKNSADCHLDLTQSWVSQACDMFSSMCRPGMNPVC